MGFTPAQVDAMSAWEFTACAAGYGRAHGGVAERGPDGMSDQRMRDLGLL
jgi:hypothetical protein